MNFGAWYRFAVDALSDGEPVVMATVVRLDGSGYGRPGARLVLARDGRRCGYISGGCLERDLCRRAWDATARGPKLIAFDTRGNAVRPPRYNTGCDGVVSVLCQRIESSDDPAVGWLQRADRTRQTLRRGVVYRSSSTRWPVGQTINANHHDIAAKMADASRSHSIVWRDGDGSIEAMIEVVPPRPHVVIFGAGDDVVPLHHRIAELGWRQTIVGRRPELANRRRFPHGEVLGDPRNAVGRLNWDADSHAILMTHDFDWDAHLLPRLIESPARSIGILGPKRRLGRLIGHIMSAGGTGAAFDDATIARLHGPIGLDIGAVTPEEIAVAIVAELIAMRNGRGGGELKHRIEPLHDAHRVAELTPATSPAV